MLEFYTDCLTEITKDINYCKRQYFGVKVENPETLEKLVSELKMSMKNSSKSSGKGISLSKANKFLEK